jgi:molybdopterin-guanine dinucleotide biosynthesis protein A
MGGENKAFVEVGGERIIDRTIRIFKEIFAEIILVTNSPLEYVDYDVQIVTDLIKGKAALGGIYTGLFYSNCEYSFVVPCDMPFLNSRFIEYMINHINRYDIVVPNSPDGLQPLHAIYSRKCLLSIRNLIDRDNLKIRSLYEKHKTSTIPADVIKTFDPQEQIFLNINSKKDLERILKADKNPKRDAFVKSRISPPLVGGDKGEGDVSA